MRMTIAHVRAIAEAVQDLTDGQRGQLAFGLDYGGRGTRVISMDKWEVWYGRNSLRRAAAYYLGMYDRLGMREEVETPDKIAEALYIVSRAGLVGGADYLKGIDDAASWLNIMARVS